MPRTSPPPASPPPTSASHTYRAPIARSWARRRRAVAAISVLAAVVLAGQAGFGRAGPRAAVTVQWGDTLWGLSRRYGISMDQLASANQMQLSDVLLAGRTLIIPAPASAATTNADGTASATTAPEPAPGAPGAQVAAQAPAQAAAAAAHQSERTFCATYQPPTGSSPLPADLAADRSRLALRPLFVTWARAYGVPADLMEAEAWQESGWSNDVVSPAGAQGIGQILPETAVFINQVLGTHLKLGVPSDNIRMMAAFLGYLLHATDGQVCGAVASYYQGLGTLQRVGVLPVSQAYVRNVLSLRSRFR